MHIRPLANSIEFANDLEIYTEILLDLIIAMQNTVLGTMNILYPYSSYPDKELSKYTEIIEQYLYHSVKKHAILDTAYYYGNTQCERVLGEILPNLSFVPKIATKVNPWFENDFSNGKLGQLSNDGICKQLNTSFKNLKVDCVEILFLHCPDYETPIQETLETCDELWRKEKFNRLGISNFSFSQTNEIISLCEDHSFITPTYYQGMYNLISRKVEEMFPLLDSNGIEFWAYNPLAGGLLTGKYIGKGLNTEGRFKNNAIYQNIFWKPEILEYLDEFFNLGQETCLDYSLQWLRHLSKMRPNDKIVLGASTVEQLHQNIQIINKQKLQSIKEIIYLNHLYTPIREFTPNYYY